MSYLHQVLAQKMQKMAIGGKQIIKNHHRIFLPMKILILIVSGFLGRKKQDENRS